MTEASLPVGVHWHAYAYTSPPGVTRGYREVSFDSNRWLRRRAEEIVATFEEPEEAAAWMREQLDATPPWSEGDGGYAFATLYTRQILHEEQYRAPWASYQDRHGRYVMRILAPCPRPRAFFMPTELYPWEKKNPPCPLGPRRRA